MDSDVRRVVSSNSNIKSPESGNRQYHVFHNQVLKSLMLFAMVSLACLVLYQTEYPIQFRLVRFYSFSLSRGYAYVNASTNSGNEEDELERVLQRAAMSNKTVLITTLNEAWAEPNSTFDLFLESFRIGNQTLWLLKHLVVAALDQKAYARCLELHPNCFFLKTDGVDFSVEAHFMSPGYLKMMWRRIDFLRIVLDMGYSFIFTDTDIMWFRNPFPHFYLDADFQIACDNFLGNPLDLNNAPNGGFNYVKSSNQTIQFYKFWYKSRQNYPRKHDQDVLNMIKYDPFISEIGLKIKFLDTAYFGGFCQPSKDLNFVCTMHSNCCVGLDNKVHDLKILLQDWTKYLDLPPKLKESKTLSWTVPQRCGYVGYYSYMVTYVSKIMVLYYFV
ncbi:unnamed protein product [Fraxinus pennsylvanica]|uniref:Glycosyltransferase n=1 Tax=Fraxinus pennsylvanica TaxID=56036 RepID=A0AAD1YS93_9LAMI|nr:unnamed protein product [Fraxinus pennsylvanica]